MVKAFLLEEMRELLIVSKERLMKIELLIWFGLILLTLYEVYTKYLKFKLVQEIIVLLQ